MSKSVRIELSDGPFVYTVDSRELNTYDELPDDEAVQRIGQDVIRYLDLMVADLKVQYARDFGIPYQSE